jgi:hypothetical protein
VSVAKAYDQRGETGKSPVLTLTLQPIFGTPAEEHGRIKKKPPTAAEAERIASEMVKNDSSLQRGDIVATDRGFFLFRGLAQDGSNNEFVPVPNPLFTCEEMAWN